MNAGERKGCTKNNLASKGPAIRRNKMKYHSGRVSIVGFFLVTIVLLFVSQSVSLGEEDSQLFSSVSAYAQCEEFRLRAVSLQGIRVNEPLENIEKDVNNLLKDICFYMKVCKQIEYGFNNDYEKSEKKLRALKERTAAFVSENVRLRCFLLNKYTAMTSYEFLKHLVTKFPIFAEVTNRKLSMSGTSPPPLYNTVAWYLLLPKLYLEDSSNDPSVDHSED